MVVRVENRVILTRQLVHGFPGEASLPFEDGEGLLVVEVGGMPRQRQGAKLRAMLTRWGFFRVRF